MTIYFKESEIPSIVEEANLLAKQDENLFEINACDVRRMVLIGSYAQNNKSYVVYGFQNIGSTYLMCIECCSDIHVHNIACYVWGRKNVPEFDEFKIPPKGFEAMRLLSPATWNSFSIKGYQDGNHTYLVWTDWDDGYIIRGAKKVVW